MLHLDHFSHQSPPYNLCPWPCFVSNFEASAFTASTCDRQFETITQIPALLWLCLSLLYIDGLPTLFLYLDAIKTYQRLFHGGFMAVNTACISHPPTECTGNSRKSTKRQLTTKRHKCATTNSMTQEAIFLLAMTDHVFQINIRYTSMVIHYVSDLCMLRCNLASGYHYTFVLMAKSLIFATWAPVGHLMVKFTCAIYIQF